MLHSTIKKTFYLTLLFTSVLTMASETATTLVILSGDGKVIEVTQPLATTIATLKEVVSKNTTIPMDQVELIFSPHNAQIKDTDLLRNLPATYDRAKKQYVHSFTFYNNAVTPNPLHASTEIKPVVHTVTLIMDGTPIILSPDKQSSLRKSILHDAELSSYRITSIAITATTH